MRDLTADVVVLGGGPSGWSAAIEASSLGADVVIVERSQSLGGNAAKSTGYVALVNTSYQRARGHNDSIEQFMDDARAENERINDVFGVYLDEDLVRTHATESDETFEWLGSLGLRFRTLVSRPRQHTVDRLHALDAPTELPRVMSAFAGRVVLGTRATGLIRTGQRVEGVEVIEEHGENEATVHARKGVVLSTGGFQASHKYRSRYQARRVAEAPFAGLDTCEGDGHRLGASVGGDLVNMSLVEMQVRVGSSLLEEAIAVNTGGLRFHDETGPYRERLTALQAQRDGLGFYLFDHHTFIKNSVVIAQSPGTPYQANSLSELAHVIGCDEAGVIDTVMSWNSALSGNDIKDHLFGRVVFPTDQRGIEEPPFYALRMTPGIGFLAGGFVTSAGLNVLDTCGRPISGLLAVGDCLGGVNAITGLGGIHLGTAFTLGRLAGRSAALHS